MRGFVNAGFNLRNLNALHFHSFWMCFKRYFDHWFSTLPSSGANHLKLSTHWKTLKTENHGAENEIENSLVLNLPTYLTLQAGESGGHKRQSFH